MFIKELVKYSQANRGLYVIVISPKPLWRTFSGDLADIITCLHFRRYTYGELDLICKSRLPEELQKTLKGLFVKYVDEGYEYEGSTYEALKVYKAALEAECKKLASRKQLAALKDQEETDLDDDCRSQSTNATYQNEETKDPLEGIVRAKDVSVNQIARTIVTNQDPAVRLYMLRHQVKQRY